MLGTVARCRCAKKSFSPGSLLVSCMVESQLIHQNTVTEVPFLTKKSSIKDQNKGSASKIFRLYIDNDLQELNIDTES